MNIPILNSKKMTALKHELGRCRPGHCVLTDDGLILTEREACLRKYGLEIGFIAEFLPERVSPPVEMSVAA